MVHQKEDMPLTLESAIWVFLARRIKINADFVISCFPYMYTYITTRHDLSGGLSILMRLEPIWLERHPHSVARAPMTWKTFTFSGFNTSLTFKIQLAKRFSYWNSGQKRHGLHQNRVRVIGKNSASIQIPYTWTFSPAPFKISVTYLTCTFQHIRYMILF